MKIENVEDLVNTKTSYRLLVNALLDTSDLNYNGADLRFDDCSIRIVLRALEPELYRIKLLQLQNAKAEKEGDQDG